MPRERRFSQNSAGRLTAVKYASLTGPSPLGPNPTWLVDMYSYTVAGLPATKRLQVNESLLWQDKNGFGHGATGSVNLDVGYTYNNEGKITSMTYPTLTTGYTSTGT